MSEVQYAPDPISASAGHEPERYIFVGGSGRSGTTLMQKMLCSHSLICGGPEFDHLAPLMKLVSRMTSRNALNRQSYYYDSDKVEATARELVRDLVAQGPRKRKPGARFVSEKTPSNIDVAAELLQLFPEARFVHLVRDGRDVASSHGRIRQRMLEANAKARPSWLREFEVPAVARIWKRNVLAGSRMEQAADDSIRSRFLTVRFEELVRAPAVEIERICSFIGIEPEPAMLQPEQLDSALTGQDANIDGIWYTSEQFGQPLNDSSVGSWKRMGMWDRLVANLLMARELQALGYPVAGVYRLALATADLIRGRKSPQP